MDKCLVILSGGQDSTTCLFWAKHVLGKKEIHAVTFDYDQKHAIEIESAKKVAEVAGVASHVIITVGPVLRGTSPLVNPKEEVGTYESTEKLPGGVEPTFIPGRNILFLTLASNLAASLNTDEIVIGVCEEDFGGYFDCRREFIDSMEKSLSQGIYGVDNRFRIHTPLMNLTKRQTVELAVSMEGCMGALAYSHTCYKGMSPPCGHCHACLLRARGFKEAGVDDPILKKTDELIKEDFGG